MNPYKNRTWRNKEILEGEIDRVNLAMESKTNLIIVNSSELTVVAGVANHILDHPEYYMFAAHTLVVSKKEQDLIVYDFVLLRTSRESQLL